MTAEELKKIKDEGGIEIEELQIDRVDIVANPAISAVPRLAGGGIVIMKQEHPDNANDKHLGRSKDEDNPLAGLDPTVKAAFDLMIAAIKQIQADVRELRAADRVHANSLLKSAPAKPATPKSKQPPGGDDDVVVSKSAVEGKRRVSFRNIIYAESQS